MKAKRKKGSSLVMVVFVTAIIFTVGTVMLALVQTDYKSRLQRSESIKNLYSADSGLNLVDNVIRKEAETAMFCAANQVKRDFTGESYTFIKDDAVVDNKMYNKINNCFKYYFITALTQDAPGKYETKENNNEILRNCVEKLEYNYVKKDQKDKDKIYSIKDLTSSKKSIYEDDDVDANEGKNAKITVNEIKIVRCKDVDPVMLETHKQDEIYKTNLSEDLKKIEKYDEKNDKSNKSYITISVTSQFYTDKNGKQKSPKTITTKFIINAPDYDEALTTSVENAKLKDYTFLRAITCDGNLVYNPTDIDNDNRYGATINGSVWVKGKLEDPKDESKKYDSGIIVNGGKFKIQGLKDKTDSELKTIYGEKEYSDGTYKGDENYNGNVFSNGSVSLIGNCNVSLPTVYARNVYSGVNTDYTKGGSNIKLDVNGSVTTNNDLVINSSNTKVNIRDSYYGINDVNSSSDDSKEKANTRRASSIIINKDEDNDLKINEDAYINGVAFLDINDDNGSPSGKIYETGESISVQGNYNAYTEVLPNEKAKLEYYDAYTLIGGSVDEKAEHFNKFYENKKASNGGVEIGRYIYAIGASVEKNDVQGTDKDTNVSYNKNNITSNDALKKISGLKTDYAKKVLLMNYTNGSENYDEIYNKYVVSISVLGKDGTTPVVDFAKYESTIKDEKDKVIVTGKDEGKLFKPKYYKTLYDCNEDDEILVKHNGVYINNNKTTSIDVSKNGEIDAVIITKGNVVFDSTDGDIDYHGTVVAGGNVIMKGNNNIKVTFDKKDVQYALIQQKVICETLEQTYLVKNENNSDDNFVQASTKLNAEGNYAPTYDSKNLKHGFWKLGAKK